MRGTDYTGDGGSYGSHEGQRHEFVCASNYVIVERDRQMFHRIMFWAVEDNVTGLDSNQRTENR